ncbi:MAG: DUF2520 domain-containing protein [Chloracidobacterium sp.]|nr:DUF2520 domain-containing protein [Chloracidobacterium sp.]
MMRVSIIGIGRVGGALALALPKEQFSVQNLIYRGERERVETIKNSLSAASAIAFDGLSDLDTDILFITTQDSEIASVSKQLSNKLSGKPYVFHTSGALSSLILDDLKSMGCKTGSIHPLVSVSSPEAGTERFRDAYFCVEGEPDAVNIAREIVTSLCGIPFSIDTEFKTLYHAAAVTACGHLVALFDAAVEMMSKTGLSEDDSKKILLPLVKSTVQNLGEQGTAAALTGTFARADVQTFVDHLKILNTTVSDDLLEIYLLLGERSLELAAKQGVNPAKIDSMRTKVSIAKSKLKW